MLELSYVMIGILLSLSFYHFCIYLGRQHDKSNLAYIFLNLSMVFIIATRKILPGFISNFTLLKSLSVLSVIAISGSSNYFPLTIFQFKKKFKIISFILFIIIACTGLISIGFFSINLKFLFVYNIFIASGGIYAMAVISFIIISYILKKQQQNEKKLNSVIIVGYISLLMGFTVLALLSALNIEYPAILLYFPIIIMISIFGIALTISFNEDHKKANLIQGKIDSEVNRKIQKIENLNKNQVNLIKDLNSKINNELNFIIKNSMEESTLKSINLIKNLISGYEIKEKLILKDEFFLKKCNKYNLSDSEINVLICTLQKKTNKEIADVLYKSIHTIKTHMRNIYDKTSCCNKTELIKRFL